MWIRGAQPANQPKVKRLVQGLIFVSRISCLGSRVSCFVFWVWTLDELSDFGLGSAELELNKEVDQLHALPSHLGSAKTTLVNTTLDQYQA